MVFLVSVAVANVELIAWLTSVKALFRAGGTILSGRCYTVRGGDQLAVSLLG